MRPLRFRFGYSLIDNAPGRKSKPDVREAYERISDFLEALAGTDGSAEFIPQQRSALKDLTE